MTNGTLTVNGQTANVFCDTTCKLCGQISYSELFNLSTNVTPKDDWFPASYRLFSGSIGAFKLPYLYVTEGPYPQLTAVGFGHDRFAVYSNTSSNSIVLCSGSNLNENTKVYIKTSTRGFTIEKVS